MTNLVCKQVLPSDRDLIAQISEWYFKEWQVSKERTTQRLTDQSPDDMHFHLALMEGETPVATGGLYNRVGLLFNQPRFKIYGPWVGLVYTAPEKRKSGFGGEILKEIEVRAAALGITTSYLYTHTAESLYSKKGWKTFETTEHNDHTVVLMKKELKSE